MNHFLVTALVIIMRMLKTGRRVKTKILRHSKTILKNTQAFKLTNKKTKKKLIIQRLL